MNTIEKINKVLNIIKDFKDTASVDKNLTRQEYKQKYKLEPEFNFALTAETIIEKNIPFKIIGCTGLAKLFIYYANKNNLDCDVIFTANLNDLQNNANRINGHQLISVQLDNNQENDPNLKEINIQNYTHNNTPHIPTEKISGYNIEKLTPLEKLKKSIKTDIKISL